MSRLRIGGSGPACLGGYESGYAGIISAGPLSLCFAGYLILQAVS